MPDAPGEKAIRGAEALAHIAEILPEMLGRLAVLAGMCATSLHLELVERST